MVKIGVCAEHGEDGELLVEMSLDRIRAGRASLLAQRLAAIMCDASSEGGACVRMGEVVRATNLLEGHMTRNKHEGVRLGRFIDRFVTLRGIIAGGGQFRVSADDALVDQGLARALAHVLCDLISVAEHTAGARPPKMLIAVACEERQAIMGVLLAVDSEAPSPVPTLAGSNALLRADRLVRSLGGTIARDVGDETVLFGVVLPTAEC